MVKKKSLPALHFASVQFNNDAQVMMCSQMLSVFFPNGRQRNLPPNLYTSNFVSQLLMELM